MPSPALPSVRNLRFDYPEHKLFSNLSFDIAPGVSLLKGDGGSGKTTLLRLLAGELKPQSGQLLLGDLTPSSQPTAWRQQVFWADPRSAITEQLDAITPQAWLDSLPKSYPRFRPDLMGELMEGLSLQEHIHKPFYMLSTGSRRKVLLTAAFASGASLTLLDEPFAALDKPAIRFVMELLDEAAGHDSRAWLVAHHEAPCRAPLAATIDLDNLDEMTA